ncbi:hypothetical protein TRAPUB_10412 [Trametes pubescens]|uniref:Uncharacterized protein n=1 Tax=Trametes pubescens TaxID=154538 RepID=A0A1M2VZT2_TRAPU|nr:hypothetical protein TRAPUB_10412 [Trametes pubescens]
MSDSSLMLDPSPLEAQYNVNVTIDTPHGQLKLIIKSQANGRPSVESAQPPPGFSGSDLASVDENSATASAASQRSDGMHGHADSSLSACIATNPSRVQAACEPPPHSVLEHETCSSTATESEDDQADPSPRDASSASNSGKSLDYDPLTYSYLMEHSAARDFLENLSPSPNVEPAMHSSLSPSESETSFLPPHQASYSPTLEQTFVPFPKLHTGCHLTPRTRKRIAVELPPSPVARLAVKRFKKQLAPDVLALVYATSGRRS